MSSYVRWVHPTKSLYIYKCTSSVWQQTALVYSKVGLRVMDLASWIKAHSASLSNRGCTGGAVGSSMAQLGTDGVYHRPRIWYIVLSSFSFFPSVPSPGVCVLDHGNPLLQGWPLTHVSRCQPVINGYVEQSISIVVWLSLSALWWQEFPHGEEKNRKCSRDRFMTLLYVTRR